MPIGTLGGGKNAPNTPPPILRFGHAEDWLTDFEKQVESGQRKPATLRDGIKIAVIYSYDGVKRGKIKSIYPIRATR